MKKRAGFWKGFGTALVLVSLVTAMGVSAGAAGRQRTIEVEDGVKVEINGARFTPKDVDGKTVPVFIYNGTTYAPIRAVCEAAGMDVEFDSKTRTVELTTPDWELERDGDAERYISADEAKEIARKDAKAGVGNTAFLRVRLEKEDGRAVYDVEFYCKGVEYDYEIDALTGRILDIDNDVEQFEAPEWKDGDDDEDDDEDREDAAREDLIGEKKARKIALNKAGKGAVVESCELDEDDGKMIYELELRAGSTEYECEIDAKTGAILHWESDTDD